jgi:hypothetical protein
LIAPVIGAMRKHRSQFDLSTGRSGPHDFTSASALLVRMKDHACQGSHVHRIPAPRIVTTARTPLSAKQDARSNAYFPKKGKRKISSPGGFRLYVLESLAELFFPHIQFLLSLAARARRNRTDVAK